MRMRAAFASVLGLLAMIALPVTPASAADGGDTVAEITGLLDWFLAPQNNPKAATHQRFWADDLVYTRSTGVVRTKAEIMAGFTGDPPPADETSWSAEDVLVRPYGDAAALTFRLVGRAADGSSMQFRNSAMFLKRNGEWRAVTWQATRVPDQPAQ
ncbi:MAG TPA: nuclear transport factor 2 family protein [Steroidobacteraceae bacterium]|nr:nuclear transport factor 2 family protein [Steroidobacteraceae bacterium]